MFPERAGVPGVTRTPSSEVDSKRHGASGGPGCSLRRVLAKLDRDRYATRFVHVGNCSLAGASARALLKSATPAQRWGAGSTDTARTTVSAAADMVVRPLRTRVARDH